MTAISFHRTLDRAAAGSPVGAFWQRLVTLASRWSEAARVAAELDQLDDRSLADLGISRRDIPKIARAVRRA